jgi:hypothetical protein
MGRQVRAQIATKIVVTKDELLGFAWSRHHAVVITVRASPGAKWPVTRPPLAESPSPPTASARPVT